MAPELPPKSEQTDCEMECAQRKLYDELRQHYRNALLKRIEIEGLAKSKIQVLEALLPAPGGLPSWLARRETLRRT